MQPARGDPARPAPVPAHRWHAPCRERRRPVRRMHL